jgi:hypothetical protein
MTAWTYATLVQAIKDFTQYEETTFNTNIPTFIQNTEERILFAVDLTTFRKNQTGTLTSSNKYLAVPSDYISSFSLSVTSSGSKTFLLQKDVEYLQEYNPTDATGIPKYYAIFDINTFILAPVPSSNLAVELHYYYRPQSLTDTSGSTTTWISNYAQEALLYGSLVEAYIYMKGEPDLIALYDKRLNEALARLKNFGEGREDVDAYRDGLIRVKAT